MSELDVDDGDETSDLGCGSAYYIIMHLNIDNEQNASLQPLF